MGCNSMPDITKPLPCPKCGKEPRHTVWTNKNNGHKMHQYLCCGIPARRHSEQAAVERWNQMVLELLIKTFGEGSEQND